MSAICGLINFDGAPVDPMLLRKMAEAAAHHGPDGIHYWVDGNVGVAHLAFNSTPESLGERQPLLSADGRLCITADARVDNRPELIASLSQKGYAVPKSPTDSDLILAAYQCWGASCLSHIIGDFAFAVWDKAQKHLFCGRDALSIKPFVYSKRGDLFCFASEAQQLLQHPAISNRVDEISIVDFLMGYNGEQSRTFFADISYLPPAHSLTASQAGVVLDKYWHLERVAELNYSDSEAYTEHFSELFERAVQDRLRSSVPVVGIELSGGLDSSSVAAVASEAIKERNNGRLTALTLIYNKIPIEDERRYSQAVADYLGIEVHFIPNDEANLVAGLNKVSLESPYRGWEKTEKRFIAQFKALGGQILLTGAGGDDLLSGSALVYADQLRRGDLSALGRLRKDAHAHNEPFGKLLYSWFIRPHYHRLLKRPSANANREQLSLSIPPWIQSEFAARTQLVQRLQTKPPIHFKSWARRAIFKSISQMANVYSLQFHWMSRLAASQSIEHRHPFLDRRLCEFILSLPPEQLWHTSYSKYILRQSMTGRLPESIRLRPGKTSYASITHHHLRHSDARHISHLLEASLAAKLGFINSQKLQDSFRKYLAGQQDGRTALTLIRLVNLEVWLSSHPQLIDTGDYS